MTTPIDIIAAAVHAADCGCGVAGVVSRNQAEVAVNALTDERIVDHVVSELMCHLRFTTRLDEAQMRDIARVVLHSVGGG